MRKIVFSLILGAAALVPGMAFASQTNGEVIKADPQLTQTYWSTLNVRDGVRERDEVSVTRNGQKIADGLVVSVVGDHSSFMLKGANVIGLVKGDVVAVVKHAAVVAPATVVSKTAAKGAVAYKVVGGHSVLDLSSAITFPATSFTNEPINSNLNVSGTAFNISAFNIQPINTSGGFNISLGLQSSTNFNSNLNLTPFSANSTVHF